jgi:hypothetical protein
MGAIDSDVCSPLSRSPGLESGFAQSRALTRGRISLGTAAHHPWQLEFIEFGPAAALKAKIPADHIINFMPLEKLRRWVATVRRRSMPSR